MLVVILKIYYLLKLITAVSYVWPQQADQGLTLKHREMHGA